MKRFCLSVACAVVLPVLLASVSSAATIYEVMAEVLPDATQWYNYSYVRDGTTYSYGSAKAWLNQALLAGDGKSLDPTARPLASYVEYVVEGGAPPAGLKFEAVGGGAGGGGGGGGGAGGGEGGPVQSTFTIGNSYGAAWEMDFSMLLFDPGFTGDSVVVELLGSAVGSDRISRELTAAEVIAGIMLTWRIAGEPNEDVWVRTTAYGGETYAAGFFASEANFQVPEPATLGLLAIGGTALAMRRRGR